MIVARLRRRLPLLALCVGGAVLETLLVTALAPGAGMGLVAQGTAPPPFDVFHDVRWIVVYHESWAGLAVELGLFLLVRSLFTAFVVRAAWPRGVAPEPFATTLRRSVWFTALVAVLLAPVAGVLFAMAVVSLSWFFFVAVPVALMLALLVHGGAVSGSWWRTTPPAQSLVVVVMTFVSLTVFGSILATGPAWTRVPVAVVAGTVNAMLWLLLVEAVLVRRRVPRRVAIAPIGVIAVVVLVVGGTTLGFVVAGGNTARAAGSVVNDAAAVDRATAMVPASAPGDRGVLFVVTGFNTEWGGTADQFVKTDLVQQRFSYRGTRDGVPLPYTRDDTHRSLATLTAEMSAQVDAFAQQASVPVTIVAESEGSLLAKLYLASHPRAPVRNLVILSPLVDPGRVYYPKRGDDGWGAFGALELSGLAWALGGVSPVHVGPDTPFLRSLVDHAPAVSGVMTCATPRVHEVAVLPLDTGVSARPRDLGIPYTVVPAFHGGMLDDAVTARVVRGVVTRGDVPAPSGWAVAERVLAAGSAAWQVPRLEPDLNHAWRHAPSPDDCHEVRAHLRHWLG